MTIINKTLSNLRMFLWLVLLIGIIYPLIVTGIAQLTMKQKADGGLIMLQGKPIGAALIAQKFEGNQYFWARPSFTDYNALPSGGSNLGPTSAALKQAVEERRRKIAKAHSVEKKQVPAELLFTSASGLDPHISITTAYFQVDRVATSRGLESKDIKNLIDHMTINRGWGFLGEVCVNVLLLNIALDEISHKAK